jgi:hypothetical protein
MTETLWASVMEFQGDKDQPNDCNREKKPERNHPRKDDYVGVVDVNVQSAWQDTEPNDEGDYGEQSSANQIFEHGGPPNVSRNNYIVSRGMSS